MLSTSDDLLSWPGQSNAVPEIETEYDDEQEEIWRDSLLMEQGEVQLFVSFTRSINDVLARLMAHSEWRFLDIALGFLIKAFFSEGLQQLLWHISVVESLLGEKKEGITELLSRRVACILGKTRKERASVYKSFKKLYDFRSDLVHGNRELLKANKIYVGHLREARHVARETLLWFVHCLDHVDSRFIESPCNHGLPKREDILSMLDMDTGSRARVEWLFNNLFSGFPHPIAEDEST